MKHNPTSQQIPGDEPFGHPHERLAFDGSIAIQEEGFIYIFVSNDDGQDMDVYFDDFRVTHEYGDIVAGGDHYPFGLAMGGRQVTREPYRYGYQGQFSEKDGETGWNSFEARMYDAVTGRWSTPDPYFLPPWSVSSQTIENRLIFNYNLMKIILVLELFFMDRFWLFLFFYEHY